MIYLADKFALHSEYAPSLQASACPAQQKSVKIPLQQYISVR